ncbi:extracellular solute-binding protein, partial [Bellilinea sp.]
MFKKVMPLIGLLLIASFVLAACQPAATPTTAPQQPTTPPAQPTTPPAQPTTPPTAEQVTITIWHQWDGKYLEAITQAFKDYEASHPNVKIDLSKPEDVANALNVAIPAGEGPDIIGWANDKIGEQALQGNIVALNDFGIDKAFLESVYTESGINGVTWMDTIWALPETMEGIALVANKALVTEEYLPKDPFAWDDLLAKAEKFYADKGIPLICNQGFGAEDAYHLSPIYFGFGVPAYVDEDGNAYMDTPEALKAAEWLVKLKAVSLAENSYDICNAALQEGKVGMWWTGPWAIAGIEDAGIDYTIVSMGKPFVGIKTLMLSKNAVDRGKAEVALDVMKY